MGDVTNWGSNSVGTYLILKSGTDLKSFNTKIKDFTKAKLRSLGASDYWIKWEGDLFAQKYSDRYLHDHFENGKLTGGRIEYVKLFSIIAIFILVIGRETRTMNLMTKFIDAMS